MALRHDGFDFEERDRDVTLCDMFGAAADADRMVAVVDSDEVTGWGRLLDQARKLSSGLRAFGVGRGSHVAVLSTNSREAIVLIEAIWLAGATVVALPIPTRGSAGAVLRETRLRLRAADASLLVVDSFYAELGEALTAAIPVRTIDEVQVGSRGSKGYNRPSLSCDQAMVLQFTSGSTADPRLVTITHGNALANIGAMIEATEFDATVVTSCSWLPLSHDMGLFGFLALPMATGSKLVLASPATFVKDPQRWMNWMSNFRATRTAAPSFAYAMATRALASEVDLDLSSCDLLLGAAEPVSTNLLASFAQACGAFGLSERAISCAYGLAESTLAVSAYPPLTGLRTDIVRRGSLSQGSKVEVVEANTPEAKVLARCGYPVPGTELNVVDQRGTRLSERFVGEIVVRGRSVSPGYYKGAASSAAVFRDGWLHTGDLGYLADGEIVVCGRLKEMIIVGGVDYYPEDIERVVETIPGVRPGNVVAVGVPDDHDRERVLIVAEHRSADEDSLRHEIRRAVAGELGLRVREVRLIPPGTLEKTSSGKARRVLVREGAGGSA